MSHLSCRLRIMARKDTAISCKLNRFNLDRIRVSEAALIKKYHSHKEQAKEIRAALLKATTSKTQVRTACGCRLQNLEDKKQLKE